MIKVCTFSLILYWIVISSSAQKVVRIDHNQIDKIVRELKDSLNIPGISVGIAVGNKIRYVNVFGYENLDENKKLTINSIWPVCSISKQFTTVACLKLVEEHKLSLQDKISKYIDNLPEAYSDITVSNLLSHTSGIKDYLNEMGLYGLPWNKVKNKVFADTLNFRPSDSWRYSNTGFWIAARIVEKISGIEYNHYLAQNFFTNLKMNNTMRIRGEKDMKARVNGYVYRDNGFNNPDKDINEFQAQGDGDIMSTLNDLFKWTIALAQGKVIKKELIAELWTPTKLKNGKILEVMPNSGINYGMGWFIKNIDGDKIVWTPGSGFGFSTTSQYIPDYDLTVIVFCNKEQFLMADEIGFFIIRNILV